MGQLPCVGKLKTNNWIKVNNDLPQKKMTDKHKENKNNENIHIGSKHSGKFVISKAVMLKDP